MNRNDFLRQFVEMRKAVAPTPAAALASDKAAPASKKSKKGVKIREVIDGSVSHIIEETPPKRKVEEYLQGLCDELTAAKMN